MSNEENQNRDSSPIQPAIRDWRSAAPRAKHKMSEYISPEEVLRLMNEQTSGEGEGRDGSEHSAALK